MAGIGALLVSGTDSRENIQHPASNIQHPTKRNAPPAKWVFSHWMLGVGCSMFDVLPSPCSESDGCLVALAVFKTVVGSFNGSRYVRFVPSPPFRFTIYNLRFAI